MTHQTESAASQTHSPPIHNRGPNAPHGKRIGVVFVDDDNDFREAACGELEYLGFDVVGMPDGGSAVDLFNHPCAADIVVLDWNLEGRTGAEVLDQLRRKGIHLPVVFLTGMPERAYEHAALDGGAMDFVDKARGMEILAKRLRLILEAGKQPAMAKPSVLATGFLKLYPATSRAHWRGMDVDLTVTEFKVVKRLVSCAGEHVTYREIYDCMHYEGFMAGYGDDGYNANVRSTVKRIRNKFRAIDADFSEIENFTGFGYRWRGGSAG